MTDFLKDLHNRSKSELIAYAKNLEEEVRSIDNKFLTKKQVAERYNQSPTTIDRLRAIGKIPSVKLNTNQCGAVRFPLSGLIKFEEQAIANG